ncbi:hypothetical protein EJ357_42530 [Streptomyces cyaneochromogenes]|uniref:Uncharacterized protein n=1 Tax=Streptomyces cyaneochromogenes TaxID=2496836 RepID=A0A3Q9EUB4_9ACTN|nr:hypothetical protein [Streptomyces cyaneochromogenes]AZQ39290.1 hypothetical protein EJ357_42530 [Streptomyces cyaneochromogenes]
MTLALRDGARVALVAVVAAEWCDAFGVATRGRVQMELELRDAEPGRSSDAAPGYGSAAPASAPSGTPAVARRERTSSAQGQDRRMPVDTPRTPVTE